MAPKSLEVIAIRQWFNASVEMNDVHVHMQTKLTLHTNYIIGNWANQFSMEKWG